MKKMMAIVLAFTMILGMSMTTMAATVPNKDQTAEATVKNIEAKFVESDGATSNAVKVTAYQIVKGNYNENGFISYVKANDTIALASVTAPTSDEVTAIAKQIINNEVTLASKELATAATTDGLADYKAELEAGYWVVLVSGTVDEIYNPILVGVYYDKDSGYGSDHVLTPGEADANAEWKLVTDGAYAKSTEPKMDKSIVGADGKDNTDGNENGNDVAFGDTVNFMIDQIKVPSYSKEYSEVIVKITDKLSDGLSLKGDSIKVFAGVDELTADEQYTVTADTQGFEIVFKSEYVLAVDGDSNKLVNAGKDIVVTYSATVDTDATLNFAENTNTAKFIYSNDPADSTKVKEIEDTTYTYTFGIDASLNGSESEVTKELFKVDQDGDAKVEESVVTVTSPLEGATFTLTNDKTKKVYTATSDRNGALSFTGLDAGTYTLEETAAPKGYSLEGKTHTVEISATYNDDGTLKSYTIKIDGQATSTYEATYENDDVKEITKSSLGTTGIKNTKLINLPSTGGIGTTIFTVAGCAIMVVAAFFFFANRKKEEN